jgi:hypothetical protein
VRKVKNQRIKSRIVEGERGRRRKGRRGKAKDPSYSPANVCRERVS